MIRRALDCVSQHWGKSPPSGQSTQLYHGFMDCRVCYRADSVKVSDIVALSNVVSKYVACLLRASDHQYG